MHHVRLASHQLLNRLHGGKHAPEAGWTLDILLNRLHGGKPSSFTTGVLYCLLNRLHGGKQDRHSRAVQAHLLNRLHGGKLLTAARARHYFNVNFIGACGILCRSKLSSHLSEAPSKFSERHMSKKAKMTAEEAMRFKQEKKDMHLLRKYLGHTSWSFESQGRSRINTTYRKGLAKYDEDTKENLDKMIQMIKDHLKMEPKKLTCVYCGKAASCCDHLISPSQGGTNEITNLAPCCTSCNQSKGKMSWQDFLKSNKGLSEQDERYKKLEEYTKGYHPGGSFASPETLAKIQDVLEKVYPLLREADALMRQAVEEHRAI